VDDGKHFFGGGNRSNIGTRLFGLLDVTGVEEGVIVEIPRHWRLKQQRYALIGEECPHCGDKIFPPRDICPNLDCGRGTLKNNLNMVVRVNLGENTSAVENYYSEKGMIFPREIKKSKISIKEILEI
jgi:uncharacterized OB-fold protein